MFPFPSKTWLSAIFTVEPLMCRVPLTVSPFRSVAAPLRTSTTASVAMVTPSRIGEPIKVNRASLRVTTLPPTIVPPDKRHEPSPLTALSRTSEVGLPLTGLVFSRVPVSDTVPSVGSPVESLARRIVPISATPKLPASLSSPAVNAIVPVLVQPPASSKMPVARTSN